LRGKAGKQIQEVPFGPADPARLLDVEHPHGRSVPARAGRTG
jgi:hypothetical protein